MLDYCTAAFEQSPILSQLIASRTADALELANGVNIEVRAASFRRLRGPTYIAVIADKSAFWLSENSANPDAEIINAVRPGLATTGGPLILGVVAICAQRRAVGPAPPALRRRRRSVDPGGARRVAHFQSDTAAARR